MGILEISMQSAVMSGLEDVNSSQLLTSSNMNHLHGHSLKLYKEHFHKVILKDFFISEGDLSMEWVARRSCKSKIFEQVQEFVR